MRFTVLGSNATYPTRGHPTSGYLVENEGRAVLLDLGSGTVSEAFGRIDVADLEAAVVSHGHADHCADVASLYFRLRFGPEDSRQIPLVAPEGVFIRLETFLTYEAGGQGFRETFSDRIVDDGAELDLIGTTWSFRRTDHPVPCVATRIDGLTGALVYTSDTGPKVELEALASGCAVLVAEATFQGDDNLGTQHLTARMAGHLAADVQAGSLVLSHIRPDLDPAISVSEASEVFDGHVVAAHPGMVIDF